MMHNCISCPWMQNYTLHLTHSVSHSAISQIFECKKSTSGSIRLNCISPKIKPCIADTAFCIFSRLLHWNPLTYIRCKIAPLHCMDPSLNITPWTVLGISHRYTYMVTCNQRSAHFKWLYACHVKILYQHWQWQWLYHLIAGNISEDEPDSRQQQLTFTLPVDLVA